MRTKPIVLDTNILISALLVPGSVSNKALKKVEENGSLIFSKETLSELTEVLVRSKFDKYVSINDRLEYLQRLESRSNIIQTNSAFIDCRDPKDNKFLNLAVDAESLCIVTGDNDLLILNPFKGIPIILCSSFVFDFKF